MVRAGLGPRWRCLFANDFDARKGLSYQANWGTAGELTVADIRTLSTADLPGRADLAWGSFPCQDLSVAGIGAGLDGQRSGTFYPFWDLMRGLITDGRAPRVIALENVCGTLSSHGGRDFRAICQTFADAGYRYGALVIDAALFTPQSRPRLFLIGVHPDVAIDPAMTSPGPIGPFHPRGLRKAFEGVPDAVAANRLWWNLPSPPRRNTTFADLIEDDPADARWHTPAETGRLLDLMSALNRAKVEAAKRAGRRMVGCVYRRTRADEQGLKQQRAEVRFDDVAGCLRTPAGGSSRQTLMVVDGPGVRSRLISARETARLMGLSDDYKLPKRYNDAYHLTGDGVVVDVVRHLADHLFSPLLDTSQVERAPRVRKSS